MNLRQRSELQQYLYNAQKVPEEAAAAGELQKIWDDWHCMILIEADQAFFDRDYDSMEEDLRKELNREVTYLNLNVRQSLVLFKDLKCDYRYVANHIYTFLKLRYPTRFHMAVSEIFTGHEVLPEILRELERWTESKFYHLEDHVLSSEEEELAVTSKEVVDSRLIQKIEHDRNRKDAETMWKHYQRLESKYKDSSLFSAIYVKFVFSSVVEALYQDPDFGKDRILVDEISEIYCSKNEAGVLKVAKRNIEEYTTYADKEAEKNRGKIQAVYEYIHSHYDENIGVESLAERFDLFPGYLMFQFRVATGYNLNRFIHKTRMEMARKMLLKEHRNWKETAKAAGFESPVYFARIYFQCYGESPEHVSKG